jgi:hypothetical protein
MTSSEAVAAYVCSVVAECQPERVVGTTRFTGGENHAVHRVSYLDGTDIERDVVVRVALRSGFDERATGPFGERGEQAGG